MGNKPSSSEDEDKPTTPEEDVDKALQKKFSKVDISKSKVSLAEKALTKAKSNRMESRLFWDKIIGLNVDKIQNYADIVIRDLEVADQSEAVNKVKSAFEKLELVDEEGGVDSHVEELKLDVEDENEFKCVYGFITAILSGGKISVAYAIHQSKFKVAQKEGMSFDFDEMEAIRNHFSKNQALVTMKQENVIKKISYR